jgi:NADH-quinone oxidoreductase subunit L
MAGALLTSLYTYRLIFLVFYGPEKSHVGERPKIAMNFSLIVLCVLSLIGGFVDTPPDFGGVPALSNFLNSTLPQLQEVHIGPITELITAICASFVFATGLVLAYAMYYRRRVEQPSESVAARFLYSGWGFDALYGALFVKPYVWLSQINRGDVIDSIYDGLADLVQACYRGLRLTETGRVRWYASGLALGAAVFIVFILLIR